MISADLKLDRMDNPPNLDEAVQKAVNEIGAFITNIARNEHRYISRTGNLRRATKYKTAEDYARVFIDRAMAKYGEFVHDGQRRWPPDPFIDQAIEKYQDQIEAIFDRHIQEAVK